jgi:WD40 repeat protein
MIYTQHIGKLTGHAAPVYALEKGRLPHTIFSGGGDNIVAEWNLKTMEPEKFQVKLNFTVYSICHIPEENLLLIGNAVGGIHVIDLEKREEIRYFTVQKKAIFSLKYSSKTGHFYALSAGGVMTVWQLEEFKLLRTLPLCEGKLRDMAFNSDHSLIAIACGDSRIRVMDTSFYNELYTLEGHELSVNTVIFHPTKPLLISGGRDAHLRFYNTDQGFELVRSIPAHNFAIYSLQFSPNGKFMASASRDKTLKIWPTEDFDSPVRLDHKKEGHHHSVNALLWTEFEDTLVSTGDDKTLRLWKVDVK